MSSASGVGVACLPRRWRGPSISVTAGVRGLEEDPFRDRASPLPTSQHGTREFRVPPDLHSAYFRFRSPRRSLRPPSPPLWCPFRVIRHGGKSLLVDIGGKHETVSVDRVKPARVDMSRPIEVAQPPWRGRPNNWISLPSLKVNKIMWA